MAELVITIPDDKVQLILDSFHGMRGIDPTPQAFKAEVINEIKQTVRQYKARQLLEGHEVSQADMECDLT